MQNNLELSFCGVKFKNPVIVASTDIGRRPEYFEAYAKAGVGGIITKSVTDAAPLQKKGITMFDIRDMLQKPVKGEVPEQYYFFSRGGAMINMENFREDAKEMLTIAKQYQVVPIGSISASRLENWITFAKEFEKLGYPMIELNFGNPHGEAVKGKLGFLISQSEELCVKIAVSVMQAVSIPVVVKLTPQVDDLASLTKALKDAGIQAVTITHRFQGMVIDQEREQPVLGGFAAIGGPWMKPLSLANVAKVYRASGLEIMGSNGVDTARDVLDFIYAGASLVQVGSSMMLRGPAYATALVEELKALMENRGEPLQNLVGRVAERVIPYSQLGAIHPRRARVDTSICALCQDKVCAEKCYFGGLSILDGCLAHNEDFCSGCGLCQYFCTHDAVEIIET